MMTDTASPARWNCNILEGEARGEEKFRLSITADDTADGELVGDNKRGRDITMRRLERRGI
jgi:hypothetical protein